MKKSLLAASLALALLPLASQADNPAPAPKLGSFGIELDNRDTTVKPGDDFNRYANGHWFDGYQLKDDETRYGAFNYINDQAELQVRTIIEEMQARTDLAPGSNEQKVRDYYAIQMIQPHPMDSADDPQPIATIDFLQSRRQLLGARFTLRQCGILC